MCQIVSKQSLDALANLAFTELKIRADGNTHAKAQFNLVGSSGEALYKFLGGADGLSESVRDRLSALSEGMELGLAIAAAILTHQYDADATCRAVKAELNAVGTYQEICVG
jgi:hypothetical protein